MNPVAGEMSGLHVSVPPEAISLRPKWPRDTGSSRTHGSVRRRETSSFAKLIEMVTESIDRMADRPPSRSRSMPVGRRVVARQTLARARRSAWTLTATFGARR